MTYLELTKVQINLAFLQTGCAQDTQHGFLEYQGAAISPCWTT